MKNKLPESIVTFPERFESLINTWERAYLVTLVSHKNMRRRLKELQEWDDCNGNTIEHSAKIEALQRLLS